MSKQDLYLWQICDK